MNRRAFLTTVFLAPIVAAIKFPPSLPIPGTWGAIVRSDYPLFRNAPVIASGYIDKNTLCYIQGCFQLHVDNPRYCGVITNIGE